MPASESQCVELEHHIGRRGCGATVERDERHGAADAAALNSAAHLGHDRATRLRCGVWGESASAAQGRGSRDDLRIDA